MPAGNCGKFNRPWSFSCFLFVSLLASGVALGRQTEEVVESNAVECSVIGYSLTNASAWASGDVLVSVSESFDNVDLEAHEGAAFSRTVFFRFVFDFDNKRFLQASTSDGEGFFLSKGAAPETIGNSSVAGKLLNLPQGFFIETGKVGRPSRRKVKSDGNAKLLQSFRMIDIRGAWIDANVGSFFSIQSFSDKRKGWEILEEGQGLVSKERDRDVFQFNSPISQGTFETVIQLDDDTRMPVLILKNFKDKQKAEADLMGEVKIKWSEMDGVHVPSEFQIRRAHKVQMDGKKTYGVLAQSVRFHWFSLNSPLSEDSFAEERVSSREKLTALLDPVRLKATTLLMSNEEREPTIPSTPAEGNGKGK